MSTALPVHVALVSESPLVPVDELAPVAAALQSQAQRDVAPIWKVSAVVAAFPTRDAIPAGYWPIIVQDKLDEPDALGYHTDSHRQPMSYVQAGKDWSVTCSHELVEMLVDPFGSRLWSASEPYGTRRARVLIEACDPCEDITYDIGGVTVSDFVTPAYYHTARSFKSTHFVASGDLAPRTLLPGGYVSYEVDGHWYQYTNFGRLAQRQLGRLEEFAKPGDSLRQAVDRFARRAR